jgi:hypothetical protein
MPGRGAGGEAREKGDQAMWAQLVKMRVRSGQEGELQRIESEWEDKVGRGTDSGWQRTLIFQSAKDPSETYLLVFFESEEKARRSEQSPAHQAMLNPMMQLVDGQPEYVDLTPVQESTR